MTSVLTLPSHMSGFLHELGNHSGVYSYVSKPTTIVTNKPKSRNDGKAPNIMIDRRVIRGNTYSAFRNQINKFGSNKQTSAGYINPYGSMAGSIGGTVPGSGGLPNGHMPPIPGRKHTQLQTEKWLETLTDKAEEADAETQTDPTTTPTATPRAEEIGQYGVDKETQIYPDDPHLFDFDKEVGVILEGLIGKTLEMSILEVMEEEEELILREQKLNHELRLKAIEYMTS